MCVYVPAASVSLVESCKLHLLALASLSPPLVATWRALRRCKIKTSQQYPCRISPQFWSHFVLHIESICNIMTAFQFWPPMEQDQSVRERKTRRQPQPPGLVWRMYNCWLISGIKRLEKLTEVRLRYRPNVTNGHRGHLRMGRNFLQTAFMFQSFEK